MARTQRKKTRSTVALAATLATLLLATPGCLTVAAIEEVSQATSEDPTPALVAPLVPLAALGDLVGAPFFFLLAPLAYHGC